VPEATRAVKSTLEPPLRDNAIVDRTASLTHSQYFNHPIILEPNRGHEATLSPIQRLWLSQHEAGVVNGSLSLPQPAPRLACTFLARLRPSASILLHCCYFLVSSTKISTTTEIFPWRVGSHMHGACESKHSLGRDSMRLRPRTTEKAYQRAASYRIRRRSDPL